MSKNQKHCKVEGCTNKGKLHSKGHRYFPRGFCSTHYKKWNKENRDIVEQDKIKCVECSVNGCNNEPPYKKGLCEKHYIRYKKYGDVNYSQYFNRDQTSHPLYETYGGIKKKMSKCK